MKSVGPKYTLKYESQRLALTNSCSLALPTIGCPNVTHDSPIRCIDSMSNGDSGRDADDDVDDVDDVAASAAVEEGATDARRVDEDTLV